MGKRLLSVLLSLALLAAGISTTGMVAFADDDTASAVKYDYELADSTADGVILHAFNWAYSTIEENLADIAAAGYTTVQTSPVQQPKSYTTSQDTSGQWWKLYQPLSFSVAEESWLGTKADLVSLCAEAEKYGIKIICDIVSNHMANDEDGNSYTIYDGIAAYEPDIYNSLETSFHQVNKTTNDSSVRLTVQGSLDGLPDLNTSDELVQSRVISLLEECIDCGVDGFRFDAAKHIETPYDGDYASDYWPNVIGAATEYALATTGEEIYCYGEILNTPGTDRSMSFYTDYINVTDNKTGDATLYYVTTGSAASIVSAQGYSYSDIEQSDVVVWAESHDTYMGTSGSSGLSNTADVSNEDIAKAWAIVAARDNVALYLARPNALMGLAGDSGWKSTVVSEVNKFHNLYADESDAIYYEGDVVAVQRGTDGIVLVNLGDSSDVSLTTQSMTDGTYTDAVSGNEFTVSGGVISGTIGSSGVAVVYAGAQTTPRALFSKEDTSFKTDTISVTVELENAVSGTYSIDGGEAVEFTDSVTLTLGEGSVAGDVITLTVTATDGTNTTTTTHTYTKEAGSGTGVFVYFDNSVRNFSNVYVYAFYEELVDGEVVYSTANADWPGVAMDYDDSLGLYFYELPEDLNVGEARVIFSDAGDTQTSTKGHLVSSEEMIYTSTNTWTTYPADDDSTDTDSDTTATSVFYVVDGAGWVFDDGCDLWLYNNDTGDSIRMTKESPNDNNSTYAYADLPEDWTSLSIYRMMNGAEFDIDSAYNSWNCGTITTGSNAYKITGNNRGSYTTYFPEGTETLLMGDTNSDGTINTLDALAVLRHSGNLSSLTGTQLTAADVDSDGNVTTMDALQILRFFSGLTTNSLAGVEVAV